MLKVELCGFWGFESFGALSQIRDLGCVDLGLGFYGRDLGGSGLGVV